MAVVALPSQESRRTLRENRSRTAIDAQTGQGGEEFSALLDGPGPAASQPGNQEPGGGWKGTSGGSGAPMDTWGSAGDAGVTDGEPGQGVGGRQEASGLPGSAAQSPDEGEDPGRSSSSDRIVEGDRNERTGDRKPVGDERREEDKASPPAGSWGGLKPPPTSPLAAMAEGKGKVGPLGLSRGITGVLSARAKLESFMVGKNANGDASVRMELLMGEKGKISMTVQEGLRGEGVRILLSAPNMSEAETAALASDLFRNLQSQGIPVDAVESSDGRELASGGNSDHKGGDDRGEMDEEPDGEAGQGDSLADSLAQSPGSATSILRAISPSGLSGFFG